MDLNYILYNGNEAFYALVGNNSFYPFTHGIHPDDLEEFESVCKSLKEGETAVLILRYQGYIEGKYQVYEVTITDNVSPSGVKRGYNVKLLNLLTVKSIYKRNTNNVRKYRNYMSMISVYYFEYDINTNFFKVFIYIYEKSYLLVCEDFDKWYDFAVKEYIAAEKDRISLEKFRKALKGGYADFTIHVSGSFFSKDSKIEELICTGKTVTMQDGNNVFGIIRNAEGYIDRNLAYYFTEAGKDSATGLLNKRAVMEFSKDLLADSSFGKRYMMIIDIDDFKDFNDTYGHIFGDGVILTVSRVLANAINIRGIVGRIGGDEFFALTENIDNEKDLQILLKTISKNLYYAYENEAEDVHVSISVGISCYPDDGRDYDTLFKKADKALYIAKEKGKRRHIIYNEEKHGAISDSSSDAVEKFKPTLRAELCADVIAGLVVKLNMEGATAVGKVLDRVCETFEINGIRIISNTDETLYSSGDCVGVQCEDLSFVRLPEYLRLYNEFSVYAENNIQNTEKYSKSLFDMLNGAGIGSFLHMAYPSVNEPKAFIFFSIFNSKRKWSEEDKNFLLILGRLLLEIVCKDRNR